jgi:hypothetical protein
MEHPVCMKAHSAEAAIELDGVSKNISVCGILIETSSMIPPDTRVSFVVTVQSAPTARPLRFIGRGKVVRVDAREEESMFDVAVECRRPIAQLEDYLGATGS